MSYFCYSVAGMTPVTLDFETYWSTEFSLSKISFIEYIKSPQFETISVALKVGAAATQVYWGEESIREALQAIDWTTHACIAHNGNEFDFPLLVWRFDCHPAMFIDTLCMARPAHQSEVGGSLKKLSEHYRLPEKDNTILLATKGKRYADFDLDELRDMGDYNRVDTDNTFKLFKILVQSIPAFEQEDLPEAVRRLQWVRTELALSDMTARMICYPQFVADEDLLRTTLVAAQTAKRTQLEALADEMGLLDIEDVRAQLASAPKFAALLEGMGVAVPRKISKTTGKETWALAKSDEGLVALQTHDDERVQMLVAARLGVKSTLLETRLAKMLTCSQMMDGVMPVPLAYHSATTGRWGGRVWNPQNLPRVDKKIPKLSDALRTSLRAPPGKLVVVADLSGIELRVNHYLWGVESTEALYAKDPRADLYIDFAAALYGKDATEVTKAERQLAKVAQLGLGFGAGAKTFRLVAKAMGNIDLSEEEAQRVTTAWRAKYFDIVTGWQHCSILIDKLYAGEFLHPDFQDLIVSASGGRVRLPSGRFLHYPAITKVRVDEPETVPQRRANWQYFYGTGRNRSKLYSGLMCENLVQAIARDVVAEQALTIRRELGLAPAHTVHDELVYIVDEDKAEAALADVQAIMRTPPTWLPGIVLWSEGDIAQNYGAAK